MAAYRGIEFIFYHTFVMSASSRYWGTECNGDAAMLSVLGVVTPLPSPLLFSDNGHVARSDWLFGGGGDSFSDNENLIFRSRLSPLRSYTLTFVRFFIGDFLLLSTSVPVRSAYLVNSSHRFILHARNGPKEVSQHFRE